MSIVLKKPVSFSDAGKKGINQDYVFLGKEGLPGSLFIISDGEGPDELGKEVARAACETLVEQFEKSLNPATEPDAVFFQQAEDAIRSALLRYPNPFNATFSVALTLAYFGPGGLTMAYTTSGRAYLLGLEEAALQKKWYSGAIASLAGVNTDFSSTGATGKFSSKFYPKSHLRPSEMVVLMSQGYGQKIDEAVMDAIIKESDSQTPEGLLQNIGFRSNKITDENHSLIIIPIQKVEYGLEPAAASGTVTHRTENYPAPAQQSGARRNWVLWALIGGLIAVTGLGFWWWNNQISIYKGYMTQGNQHMQSEAFDSAVLAYQNALRAGATQGQRKTAQDSLLSATEKRAVFALNAMRDVGFLNEAAVEYLTKADMAFKAGRYPEAALNYRLANLRKAAQSDKTLEIPAAHYAEALTWTAAEIFELGPAHCDLAYRHVNEATKTLEQNKVTPADTVIRTLFRLSSTCNQVASSWLTANMERLEAQAATARQSTRKVGPNPNARTETREAVAAIPTPPVEKKAAPANARVANPASSPTQATRGSSTTETPAAQPAGSLTKGQQQLALTAGKEAFRKGMKSKNTADYQEAIRQLKVAASQTDGEGYYMLAYLYHMGLGTKQNETTALTYARKSALAEWPSGQFLYGSMMVDRPSKTDKENGIKALRQAADNGHVDAVNKLRAMGVVWP